MSKRLIMTQITSQALQEKERLKRWVLRHCRKIVGMLQTWQAWRDSFQARRAETGKFTDKRQGAPTFAARNSGGSKKNLKKVGGAKDNVSALYTFIANAQNELHAFYTGKGRLFEK